MIKLTTAIPVLLNKVRPGSTFLSIRKYIDNHNGQADYGIVFHVNYLNAVRKALITWIEYVPKNDAEARVRLDLIQSYTETLQGTSNRSTSAHAYQTVSDGKAPVNGVKWHDKSACVHMWGFIVHKATLVPGQYPPDRRAHETIVRQELMKLTPLWRFRQFALKEGRFDSINVEHLNLTQKDLIRSVNS